MPTLIDIGSTCAGLTACCVVLDVGDICLLGFTPLGEGCVDVSGGVGTAWRAVVDITLERMMSTTAPPTWRASHLRWIRLLEVLQPVLPSTRIFKKCFSDPEYSDPEYSEVLVLRSGVVLAGAGLAVLWQAECTNASIFKH